MRALLTYITILYSQQKKRLTLSVLLTIITIISNIILITISNWLLTEAAITGIAGLNNFNYMLPAAGVRIAAIVRTVSRWAEKVVSHDTTFRVLKYLRIYIFKRIFSISNSIKTCFYKAELLDFLIADVNTLDHLYLKVISPLSAFLIIAILVTTGFYLLDKRLGLIIGSLILIILILFPPIFYYIGKPIGKTLTILRNDYRIQLNNWLFNNDELTVYGAAKNYRSSLENTEQLWQSYQKDQKLLTSSAQSLQIVISGVTIAALLWFIAGNINKNYSELKSMVALFTFIILTILEMLNPVTEAFQYLGQVITSAKRINTLINISQKVIFPDIGPTIPSKICIKIKHIQFYYPKQTKPLFNNLSLTVNIGERIGIIGQTGGGKSTLLKLLTRAWDPQKGNITINDIPLTSWTEKCLRKIITIVPQNIHIFNSNLRDNLLLTTLTVDNNKLYKIIHQTGLEKLLIDNGLNTWLGEGGRTLSSGEKRRIGIARMLLHDAPLCLLDEPTENLDIITEKKIFDLLIKTGQNRTMIVITHHLEMIENFDCIYILDRGDIIEQGNHNELMKKKGRYYYLYNIEKHNL